MFHHGIVAGDGGLWWDYMAFFTRRRGILRTKKWAKRARARVLNLETWPQVDPRKEMLEKVSFLSTHAGGSSAVP